MRKDESGATGFTDEEINELLHQRVVALKMVRSRFALILKNTIF